jgi:hypothetical protein
MEKLMAKRDGELGFFTELARTADEEKILRLKGYKDFIDGVPMDIPEGKERTYKVIESDKYLKVEYYLVDDENYKKKKKEEKAKELEDSDYKILKCMEVLLANYDGKLEFPYDVKMLIKEREKMRENVRKFD